MNIKITRCDFCRKKITIGESFYLVKGFNLIKRANYTQRMCKDCKQTLKMIAERK